MNLINWTHLGGLPFTQDRMKFIQDGYLKAWSAIAQLCGDKTILYGIQVAGGNVSSGWFSYNGELIEFIGGSVGAKVKITETAVQFIYANATLNDVQITRTATCGVLGDFDFSDLVPLLSLRNIWLPGDVKEKVVTNLYIADNFDGGGFGLNAEKGWRLLSAAYPNAKGKMTVNYDPTDVMFDTCGKFGGSKTRVLVQANLPNVQIDVPVTGPATSTTDAGSGRFAMGSDGTEPGPYPVLKTAALGASTAIDIMNPFFVTLKSIKL